jgi:hypothetical protein
MQPEQRPEPRPRAVGSADHAIEAFNPLLRSLLTWELVARVDLPDGSHRWELTETTQHRLDALTPVRRRAATSLAYLDHGCASCRQQHLTHLVDGRYLCEACQRGDAEAPGPPETPLRDTHRPSLLRRHR